jgi:hypothetical protein
MTSGENILRIALLGLCLLAVAGGTASAQGLWQGTAYPPAARRQSALDKRYSRWLVLDTGGSGGGFGKGDIRQKLHDVHSKAVERSPRMRPDYHTWSRHLYCTGALPMGRAIVSTHDHIHGSGRDLILVPGGSQEECCSPASVRVRLNSCYVSPPHLELGHRNEYVVRGRNHSR